MSIRITMGLPAGLEAKARHIERHLRAGDWLVAKARRQARAKGTFQAAVNLRKQGVPLELALSILTRP